MSDTPEQVDPNFWLLYRNYIDAKKAYADAEEALMAVYPALTEATT